MSIHAGKLGIWVSACQNHAGNEPPFDKILGSDLGFRLCYVNGSPGEDRHVTPELMTRIKGRGLEPCIWYVPRTGDPVAEARKVSAGIENLNPVAVMLDVETHDINFQRRLIAEYRRIRPGRATDWTMEPRQSITTVAAREIINARMDLFPQLYRDNMRDADPKHELRYWADQVGWDRVHLFLDSATNWWALGDGMLFDAERLP